MFENEDIKGSDIENVANSLVDDIAISATQLKEADTQYKSLITKAEKAKEQKIGIFSGKKVAIETLQDVVLDQANMINDLWSWHTKSQEHLKKLTESVHKLLFISVTNASFTRAIIETLKKKTNEPLNEAARKQLINVIRDLERQADVQDKLYRLKDDVISLKRDNLSHKDSISLLNGALSDKYDREIAEKNFENISSDLKSFGQSFENLELEQKSIKNNLTTHLEDYNDYKGEVSRQFESLIIQIQFISKSIIDLKSTQQTISENISSLLDDTTDVKTNFNLLKKIVASFKLISIIASIISVVSIIFLLVHIYY